VKDPLRLPDPRHLGEFLHPVLEPFHLRLRLSPDSAPQLHPSPDAAENASAGAGAAGSAAGCLKDGRIEDVEGQLGVGRFADAVGGGASVSAGVKTTDLFRKETLF
jgi:hypothetical protein